MAEEGFVKAQSDNLPTVDSLMVAEFFATSELFTSVEQRGVKAKRAERESYGDAAVGYVQLKRNNNICTVKCKISPEHRVRSKNYSVILEVNEHEEKILRVECQDCAASAGGCKHAIAFVMWVHRRSEEPSPTEVESYWKRPKLSGVGTSLQFVTVKDFGNKPSESLGTDTDQAFLETFVQRGLEVGAPSQIIQYYVEEKLEQLGIHQLVCSFMGDEITADEFMTYASSKMEQSKCNEAFDKTRTQSKSSLWHDLRYGRITASKIYEVSRCKTPAGTLVESVIGGLKRYDTSAMQRGRKLEKSVLKALGKYLNTKFQDCGLMLSAKYPVLGASPDGLSDDAVVEIKCPSSEKTFTNYISKDNIITNKYKAQIQLQMFLLEKSYGIFCVADPSFEENNKLHIFNVNYEEEFLLPIIENSILFWKQNIFPLIKNALK